MTRLILVVGDEVLPVPVVRKVLVGIREGTVAVTELIAGVGDLFGWTPDGLRVVLSVVPFVEEVTGSQGLSAVEEEEVGMAITVDMLPVVAEVREEVMAEVTFWVVVTG